MKKSVKELDNISYNHHINLHPFKFSLINFTLFALWLSGMASIAEANTELRGNISISEELLEITSTPGPGFHRAILPPATFDGGALKRESATFSQDLIIQSDLLKDDIPKQRANEMATRAPASISELARALKHDPDLIYEFVHRCQPRTG